MTCKVVTYRAARFFVGELIEAKLREPGGLVCWNLEGANDH